MRASLLLLPLAVLLGSCSDDERCSVAQEEDGSATITCPDGSTATVAPGDDGDDGATALLRLDVEPAGDECPEGGYALHVGVDDDDDGELDNDEIASTRYLCHGDDGLDGADGDEALIRVDDEPAGEHCAAGGQAVHVGLDTDGDGVLDDTEITDTAYVCDGVPGTSTLARLDDLPPGDTCPAGGVALHVGPDLDGDGTLQDVEIQTTRWICDGTIDAVSLVRLDEVAPNGTCPEGGYALHVGVDEDGDRTLDDPEIQATDYVCHGSDGADGADGLHTVARLDQEPPGGNCAEGGLALHTGLDLDGDGTLGDPEIDETSYVCDGADGSTALVRVDDEPAGDHCAVGGLAVHAGLDTDASGTLEDTEVQTTAYLCEPRNLLHVGDTDRVASYKGWSVRCLAWDGPTCTHPQVKATCTVCNPYEDCGMWHDITTFNNNGDRTTLHFCAVATGSSAFAQWSGSDDPLGTPTACGDVRVDQPVCTTEQATSDFALDFLINVQFAFNLETTYCLSGDRMHVECAAW